MAMDPKSRAILRLAALTLLAVFVAVIIQWGSCLYVAVNQISVGAMCNYNDGGTQEVILATLGAITAAIGIGGNRD